MPPIVATVLFVMGIFGLFWLTQDRQVKTSPALWIPVCWLLITGSRPVSQWLSVGPTFDTPDKYLDGSPLDAAIFGFLMVASLAILAARHKQLSALVRGNGLLLLFLAYCLVSTQWSDFAFVAFKRWTKIVGDVMMVFIVLSDHEPMMAMRRVLSRAGFLLIPASILFIKYYPGIGRSYNVWNWEPMYGGVTTTKNLLGMICLVYGLGSLWCFLTAYKQQKSQQRSRQLLAHGVFLFMVVWLLHMSNSMTSISCFVIAGGLMTVAELNHVARRPATVHLLFMTAVGITFSTLFLGIGSGALQSMGRDATLTGRTDIWRLVLSVAGNPFVGTGFESFWLGSRLETIWKDYGLHIQEAHNGYLEVYLNLGWIGVILLVGMILTGYQRVIRALRGSEELSYINLAFIVSSVLYNFTEAGFRAMSPTWTAFLLAMCAVPRIKTSAPPPQIEVLDSDELISLEPDVDHPVGVRSAEEDVYS